MISETNQPRGLHISSSTLRFGWLVLLAGLAILAQSQITPPSAQVNSNSTNRTHVATLHSTDSSEVSRVATTSHESLSDYQANRRTAPGRRLSSRAARRAQLRAGQAPATTATNRSRDLNKPGTEDHSLNANINERSNSSITANNPSAFDNKNAAGTESSFATGLPVSSNANSQRTDTTKSSSSLPNPTSDPWPAPSGVSSAGPAVSPTSLQEVNGATNSSSSPLSSATVATSRENSAARGEFWSRAKERMRHWLLLAQLNPVPVALGAVLLVFIIAFLLFRRRSASSTRRFKQLGRSKPLGLTISEAVRSKAKEPGFPVDTAAIVARKTASVSPPRARAAKPVATVAGGPTRPVVAPLVPAPDDGRRERIGRTTEEIKKLLAGEQYDESFVGSDDAETRRLVRAELLSALVSRSAARRDRARAAFMKHGYFEDAMRDLRIAESENERAAAARRLSFVNDPEATPHLVAALSDPSPDVRCAAVEALMELRDPAAIAPLNSLLLNETDRKVPRNVIQNAIEACASRSDAAMPGTSSALMPPPTSRAFDSEREVIEI